MAGKVFFSVTMSLDGFMAPDAVPVEYVFSPEGQNDPRVQRWMTKWSELQAWLFPQRWFRENLKLGEGGEEGLDNDIARATYERTGVSVMGKRMFDAGELAWPEEAPFHTPVFVVTHTKRNPWERPGGTTFHFVNDGIESALLQAREAAGDRDVRIAGGAETIQEYLDSGLIDEFSITLAPVLFRHRHPPVRPCGPRPPRAGPGPHGRIAPGDPPDLHRRETLARVPAACGVGVSPRGEVPVGQVSSSVRSGNRIRRPRRRGRRRRSRPG